MKISIRRRKFLISTAALGLGAVFTYAFAQPEKNVISVIAKKFEYSPNEIQLKVGVPVTLEFTSQDVVMGFNVPDLKVRTDIIPNIKTRLALTPDKVGEFPFYCDIFCGSGHEDMSGVLIVT